MSTLKDAIQRSREKAKAREMAKIPEARLLAVLSALLEDVLKQADAVRDQAAQGLKDLEAAAARVVGRQDDALEKAGEAKKALDALSEKADGLAAAMQKKADATIAKAGEAVRQANKMRAKVKEMRGPRGLPGKPGNDADPEAVARMVMAKLPPQEDLKPGRLARMLETLRGDERLDKSAVKGLEEFFRSITNALNDVKREKGGGGGGGMGLPVHETFPVLSSTVSITTSYPIAAGGNAIFKFAYQGQVLDKTDHFTVGANRRTITFSAGVQAQFEDGTTASITYIRG